MKLCNFKSKIFLEVQKSYVIKAFGHMIYWTWVIWMYNLNRFTRTFLNMITVQLSLAITFRNVWTFDSSITIDSHCSQMHQMTIFVVFHYGNENVFSWLCVVCVSIVDCFDCFHRKRCWLLLSEMDHNIWKECFKLFLE